MTYLVAPEIEIDGVIIPQFSVMMIRNTIENHYNSASLVGSFGYGKDGLDRYINPTLEGPRKSVNMKMDGQLLFTGWISNVQYGYNEGSARFNLDLLNYTKLLEGHKENLEQQKDKSYRQIIEWLTAEYDYINIKYMCGGEEDESVMTFDLGATETVINGIKRLIGRKSWSVYTDINGDLIIRSWKVESDNGCELLQGHNIISADLESKYQKLFRNYIVIGTKDKGDSAGGAQPADLVEKPLGDDDDKKDKIDYVRGKSENGAIDRHSLFIYKLRSTLTQAEADEIANDLLRKDLAGRIAYKINTPSFTDIRDNQFRVGDLAYIKSELLNNLDDKLLMKSVEMRYNFGKNGNTEYETSIDFVDQDFYANALSIRDVQKKKKKGGFKTLPAIATEE